jgi:hypothetical protein
MEKIAAAAFSLLIGVVGLWTGFKQLRNRKELNRWNTTTGKVIERGTYQVSTAVRSAPAFRHAALVRYAYQVDGKEFVNDSINPKRIQLPTHNTVQWAQKRAASFPDEVTVHYNPADPAESFLVQTPKSMLYIVIVASCVAILFGLMFCLTK